MIIRSFIGIAVKCQNVQTSQCDYLKHNYVESGNMYKFLKYVYVKRMNHFFKSIVKWSA